MQITKLTRPFLKRPRCWRCDDAVFGSGGWDTHIVPRSRAMSQPISALHCVDLSALPPRTFVRAVSGYNKEVYLSLSAFHRRVKFQRYLMTIDDRRKTNQITRSPGCDFSELSTLLKISFFTSESSFNSDVIAYPWGLFRLSMFNVRVVQRDTYLLHCFTGKVFYSNPIISFPDMTICAFHTNSRNNLKPFSLNANARFII